MNLLLVTQSWVVYYVYYLRQVPQIRLLKNKSAQKYYFILLKAPIVQVEHHTCQLINDNSFEVAA